MTAAASTPSAPKAAPALTYPAAMPQDEKDYLTIVEKARTQYSAGKSIDARKNARLGLQIDVHRFLGLSHVARNWYGIYKGGKLLDNGNRSVDIEIWPGVLISSWDNHYFDDGSFTLVRPFSLIGRLLDDLTIGEPVIFSASLIGSVISNDDDMVRRPQIIAQFTALKKAE